MRSTSRADPCDAKLVNYCSAINTQATEAQKTSEREHLVRANKSCIRRHSSEETRPFPRVLRLALLLVTLASLGFRPAPPPPFPDFDQRPRQTTIDAAKQIAAAELQAAQPESRVAFDAVTHSAAHVTARRGFLSQTAPASARGAAAMPTNPHRPTRQFLNQHRALFGHGPEALDESTVKRDFVTAHNGLRSVVWEQRLHDIAVFEGVFIAHTTARGELVSVSSRFISDRARTALRAEANAVRPQLTASEAVRRAAQNLDVPLMPRDLAVIEKSAAPAQRHRLRAVGLTGETSAELIWLPMSEQEVRLCWDVILKPSSRAEVFRVIVDAQSGTVLLRRCLTTYLTDATYRVFIGDSPTPLSPGHATPLTTQPPLVARSLVTLSALDTNASPHGWIDDGVNETRGNNADAHLDRDGNDAPDLPRPQGSPFRVFDFPLDLGQSPNTYGDAAVTQLFYWNNWMHDRLYELGFTEAAGNFQLNNFGRGGLGNDPVQADAQDGEGFNNANFFTPPDGQSPRMQMFIFPGPEPDRDGDLDAEVILHEYTHGLSNRRVGGGVGISALQTAGMGEGWSDFYALALLSEPADDVNGNYAAAGYLSYLFLGLQQSHYFGIRRFPYSTDMAKNPLTFRDLDPAQANPHIGIPRSPVFGGVSANEVHAQGEVWCVALWEARANLINKHGWTNGNQLILQFVTDGMNLSPPNPDFLQARDAILLADEINSGGSNRDELWSAFAKRGMGADATSPGSHTTAGIVEAFNLPDDLGLQPTAGFSARGPVGGPFTPNSTTFTLQNFGSNALVWNAGAAANWLNIVPGGGFLATGANASVTVSLNANAAARPAGLYNDTVRFTNVSSGRVQLRSFKLRVGQPDYFTEQFEGNFDLAWSSFTFTPDASASFYSMCREAVTNFPTDPAGGTVLALGDDTFLPLTIPGTNRVSIYGHATNTLEVGSNGYLTFGPGDSDMTETLIDHFNRRRVTGFFRDLHPGQGGSISWRQLDDRVAFTWLNVPEFDLVNSNSFQIELFFDGRIRLSYLKVDATFGLAGLSQGLGLPAGFDESDLSSSASCSFSLSIATPPTLTEGNGLLINAGQVFMPTARATNLTVTLSSSNTAAVIVPASVEIPAGQTNAFFDITVVDDAFLDGTQTGVITATAPDIDPGTRLVFVHDNETAVLGLLAPAFVSEGHGATQGIVAVFGTVGADTTVQLASDNTSELIVPATVVIPAGQIAAAFTITIVDDTEMDGAQLASITASVANWTPATVTVIVSDNESNALLLSFIAPQILESVGVQPNWGAVILAGTLPTNLVVALGSSDTTELIVPSTVTIPAGQLAAAFNVAVLNDSLVDGTQLVTVTATAPGLQSASNSVSVLDDETPPRLSIFQTSHQAVLSWTTVAGNIYQLETKRELSGAWTNAGPLRPALGELLSVTNPLSPTQQFYRVVVP